MIGANGLRLNSNSLRQQGHNLLMNEQILADNGQHHLQELIRNGAIRTQSTEMDSTFIRQFIDNYLQKDEVGLSKLQCQIQVQKDDQKNYSALDKEDHLLNEHFLLSFYIGLLLNIIESSGPAILDRPSICEFLRQFRSELFNRHSTQYSSTLCQLSYEFLLQLHKMQFPLNNWPFPIDLPKLIFTPLEDESTPISLRQTIEKLAIAQLKNIDGVDGHQTPHLLDEMELIAPLIEILLSADFSLVFESCSRILCSSKNIGQLLLSSPSNDGRLGDRIIQKAKRMTQRIGHAFAELAAKLILFQFQNANFDSAILTDGFQNRFNHSLFLFKIATFLPKESKLDGKEEEINIRKMILELLATVSNLDWNLIGPLLTKYREIYSEKEFADFFMKLFIVSKNWKKNCSAEGLKAVVDSMLEIDPELEEIVPKIVESILMPEILNSQSALFILERISQKVGGEKFLQKHSKLAKQFGELLRPILIHKTANDEFMDSALRILYNFCGQKHGMEEDFLFDRLLAISKDANFSEFLRQFSLQYLTKYHPDELAIHWTELFQANFENDEIKYLLLSNAFAKLEDLMKKKIKKEELIGCIAELMDLLQPEEEESPTVLLEAAKICEAIVNEIGGAKIDFHMFASKWAKLKGQMEMIERRHRKRNGEDLDMRAKIEEMITTLCQNCTVECEEKCGSKDCY